jgi:hypothetical protein
VAAINAEVRIVLGHPIFRRLVAPAQINVDTHAVSSGGASAPSKVGAGF